LKNPRGPGGQGSSDQGVIKTENLIQTMSEIGRKGPMSDNDLQAVITVAAKMIEQDKTRKMEREMEGEFLTNVAIQLAQVSERVKNMKGDPDVYKYLQDVTRFIVDKSQLKSKAPAFLTDLRAQAASQGDDGKGVVSKIVSRIPKFDGRKKEYTWTQFLTSFSIAVSNASYKEYELRAIFLNSLEGSALEHYQAHEADYRNLSYDQLVEKFAERYGPKRRMGLNSLMGIAQGVNEDVLSFHDRLLNTAHPFMPEKPSTKVLLKDMVTGKDTLIDNLKYESDMQQYQVAKAQHEIYLIRFFVMGLRDEVLARLQTTDYDKMDDAVEAARVAEDYLKAVQQIKTHHLKVNAISQGNSNPQFGRSEGPKEGTCFRCGRPGHWKSECRSRPNSKSNSRSNSRDRSASRSRRFSGSGQNTQDLHSMVHKLTKQISDLSTDRDRRGRSKQHKKSKKNKHFRSRSGSRQRSSSRSRGYQSRSNSQQRSRSNSKNFRK
jgi:hypothetical protein